MKLQTTNRMSGRYPMQTKLAITIARAFVGGVIASSTCQPGFAAPKGGVVAAGNVEITSTPSATLIRQSSNRAVIDWASFNIAAGEAVKFSQPGSDAAALNRIHDASPSQIFGQLNANGQVYLVNPNGIVFGRTASISVGSLMASTADITNADFMAGRMNFAIAGNPRAAVVNEGSIVAAQGGFVALAAPNVRNSGIITARLGRVTLASGDSFTLDFYGDSLISVALDRDTLAGLLDSKGWPVTRYLSNDGSILADGGRIEILAASAQNLLAATVNIGGIVRARGVESRNGVIFLDAGPGGDLAVSGKLDVTAVARGTGGRIAATGATVALLAGARADASGAEGGGTIVLGDMAATAVVNVAPGAVVAADAASRGDGGAVRLLSSGQTRFAGSISATGGDGGGNGGSVEISSTGSVIMNSSDIRLMAPAGRAGTVILDPTDLTIAHQPDSANVVSDFTLYNLLAAGNNVSLAASNDLTVAAVIEGRGGVPGGSVTLGAGHNLLVQNHILTNNGAITLTAGNLFSMDPNTMLYAGNQPVSISGNAGVATQYIVTSGNVSLSSSAGPISAAQALGYSSGGQDFPIGTLAVNGTLVAASAAPVQTVSLHGVLARGAVTVNGYDVSDEAGIKSGAAANISAARNISLAHDLLGQGGISLTSTGGAIFTQALYSANSGGSDAISLIGVGNITVNGGVRAANADYTAHTSIGIYTGNAGIDVGTGTVDIQSAGNLELQSVNAGSLVLATTGASGSILLDNMAPGSAVANVIRLNTAAGNHIALTAGRDIDVNAKIDGSAANAGDTIALTAAHDLNLANSIASNSGAVALSAGNVLTMANGSIVSSGDQAINLSGVHGVTAEYLQTDGPVNITSSSGPVTANRALVAGSVNINAFLGTANATINPSAAQTVSLSGVKTTGGVLVNAYSLADGGGINAGGNVTLQSAQGVTLSEYVLSEGNILVRSQSGGIGAKGFDTKQQSSGGAITLDAAGSISVTENVLTHNSDLNATASGGVLQISGAIDTGLGSASLTATGDIWVDSVAARNLTATTTSSGSITVNSPMAGLQHVALDSSQDITLSGVQVDNGLTTHFRGNLNVFDNILATNGSAIELGAPGNSNTNGKINLHADILSEGGNISLNNDVDVFNFRGMNSASAFLSLPGGYPFDPAAIHMVSDTTGGSGTATSFKSLIFIDNTLVPRGGTITLNIGHITNEAFNDEFHNKSSLNRLVVSAMMSASDLKSLGNIGNIGAGQAITYPTGDATNFGRYARHDLIGGTFFASGNLPEVIYQPSGANLNNFEALNQYGFFYYPLAGSTAYRLVISRGTVPADNSQHAVDWLGRFYDPGQGSGNTVLYQPTSPDTAFSGFLSNIGSPGDGVVPQLGVVGPPSTGIPATVGNGNVALALSLAVPGTVAPANPNSPPPSAALGEAIFRTSDLVQAEPGTQLGETELASDTAANTAGAGEAGITTDIVLGGPGMLAEVDLGRGTPLGGAAQDVWGKRRCIALGAPGVSAQPCVGASR